jgi:hypothetical protein
LGGALAARSLLPMPLSAIFKIYGKGHIHEDQTWLYVITLKPMFNILYLATMTSKMLFQQLS